MPGAPSLAVRVAAGTALFMLVLAAVQSRDARIAGMMLTFPALNGISLMLAPVADKRAMARAMLAVIALNGIVALAFIEVFGVLSDRLGAGAGRWIWPLSAVTFAVWLLACWGLSRGPRWLDRGLLAGYLLAAPPLAAIWWVHCPASPSVAGGGHLAGLMSAHAVRIGLFALTLTMLLAAAERLGAKHALLGRLGAFPLLPLFSLATIAETQVGATTGVARLATVKPAMLLGLLVAMAFAWAYSGYLMWLYKIGPAGMGRQSGALAGLLGGWIVTALVIVASMTAMAALEGCA